MTPGALRTARIALLALAGGAVMWLALALTLGDERVAPPPLVLDASDEREEIIVTGQSVEIAGTVKRNVLVFGGDVTLSGYVGGDVAAIGGSVNQTGGHIVGDILVVGGRYDHDDARKECRVEGTVNVFSYGESLRGFFNDPAREILAPTVDRAYIGGRVARALFSFLLALALVFVAPGPVGRASERLASGSLRLAAIGLVGTATVLLAAALVLSTLAPPAAALVLSPMLLALVLAQVFGRVVVYFFVGRWIQRRLFGERSRSQAVALALGVVTLGFLGSLPVVGALLLCVVFILSVGLVLTSPFFAGAKQPAFDEPPLTRPYGR